MGFRAELNRNARWGNDDMVADAQGQSTAQLPCPLFVFSLLQAPT